MADAKTLFRIKTAKMSLNTSSLRVAVLQQQHFKQVKAMQEEEVTIVSAPTFRRNLSADLQNASRNRTSSSLRAQINGGSRCNPEISQSRSERLSRCCILSRKRRDAWLTDVKENSETCDWKIHPDAKRQKSATQHRMTSTRDFEDDLAQLREALQRLSNNL